MRFKEEAKILVREGRVVIYFRSSDLIPQIIGNFRKSFLSLPEDVKSRWAMNFSNIVGEKHDNGYFRRRGGYDKKEREKKDKKSFFHYRYFLPWELVKRGIDLSSHRDWLEPCEELHRRCVEVNAEFVRALDEVLPGFDFLRKFRNGKELHVSRLLNYDRVTSGNLELAHSHTDLGFLTTHVADERPGLVFTKTGETFSVERDSALIFPGRKATRLTKGVLKALDHSVREQNPQAAQERWAIVFFSHIRQPLS